MRPQIEEDRIMGKAADSSFEIARGGCYALFKDDPKQRRVVFVRLIASDAYFVEAEDDNEQFWVTRQIMEENAHECIPF